MSEKPFDLSEDEVYGDWTDVDSHLGVADIQTVEEICKSIMNPQTILEQAISDYEEKNSETLQTPPSGNEIKKNS